MTPIATYVFIDLGTTGLLDTDPAVTKLSMIAVTAESFRKLQKGNIAKIHQERYCDRNFSNEFINFHKNLTKPVCHIIHYGLRFDYRLIKSQFDIDAVFEQTLCADSMGAFYDILEPNNRKTSKAERLTGAYPWPSDCYERDSYSLPNVYKKVVERAGLNMPDVETRNSAVLRIASLMSEEFVAWVDTNHYTYAEIQPFKFKKEEK